MRLELTYEVPDSGGGLAVRLVALNDSHEPVEFDRTLLVGPQPAAGNPPLLSRESPADDGASSRLTLNPWCVYGRERRFRYEPGGVTFHGYLLHHPADRLLPTGPGDDDALWAAAPPLEVRLEDDVP